MKHSACGFEHTLFVSCPSCSDEVAKVNFCFWLNWFDFIFQLQLCPHFHITCQSADWHQSAWCNVVYSFLCFFERLNWPDILFKRFFFSLKRQKVYQFLGCSRFLFPVKFLGMQLAGERQWHLLWVLILVTRFTPHLVCIWSHLWGYCRIVWLKSKQGNLYKLKNWPELLKCKCSLLGI